MTTNLTIGGMTCENCVMHVTKALQAVPGVTATTVDLQTQSAKVEHDGAELPALIAAVEEEGYTASAA